MGGGSSGPSQQQVTQTNLPEYARPYFERMMARSEGVSNQQYQPYPGQRVEGINNIQQRAMANMADQGANWAVQHAVNQGNLAGQGMIEGARFEANGIKSTYDPQKTQMFNAPDKVQATYQPGEFDAAAADKYMSPYQQKVVDIQKREAIRQNAQQGVGRNAAAAKAGAFGGSRAALLQAESDRNLATQLDDIQAKGSQSAYENAQKQYEADRQARYAASQQGLGAAQFNSQQQMAYGQAGLQNQQFNETQRMQAGQQNLQGQIANEQARAAAAGLRNQSWQNLGSMSGQMANIGKTQQDMDYQRYAGQMAAGDKIQATNQAGLDAAYDNFVNQRDYDKQQLNFYNSMLRGVPVTANSDVQTRQASNPLSQIAGLGIAGLGAYKAYQG